MKQVIDNIIKSHKQLLMLLFAGCLFSCSVKSYIPEDELLYTGAEIQVNSQSDSIELPRAIKDELEELLRPVPNSKFLGMRLGLRSYYRAQREDPGFINKFFNKKIGEEPVYLSDVDRQKTEELINNRLENRGFYRNLVGSGSEIKKYTASVDYTVQINEPYRIANYSLLQDSTLVFKHIAQSLPNSLISTGDRFDLDLFKNERERIDTYMKSKGFYNFNDDFLLFEADTNQYKGKKLDLYLKLKEETPLASKVPYKLNSIKVHANYSVDTESQLADSVQYKGITYIQHGDFFKPERLAPFILLETGQYYNPITSKFTSNRLSKIGVYKYTSIRYDQVKPPIEGDSVALLDASIFLSPLNKHALRAELQANSKSNNFVGPALALTYTNRNLFKGGEIFSTTARFGFEQQIGGEGDNSGARSLQLGLKTDLIFPRILFPLKLDLGFDYEVPKTKISTAIEYLNRQDLYRSISLLAGFGYTWNANEYVYHELIPISFNYSSLSNTSEAFEELLAENPYLRNSFEQKFIAGLNYSFVYNEVNDLQKRSPIYFAANFEIAGNALSLISGSANENGTESILGMEYAQYIRTDIDFRYQYRFDDQQALVARLFGGIGYAYGNSISMPYSKQYYSGGPFSVRAFRIRALGPGTYQPNADNQELGSASYIDQTGDIRLEANLEYRFPIMSFVKGALFADAGNVWLLKQNPALIGGEISSGFMKELGVGVGAGVRVDVQGFVIRFDLAAPIHKPYQDHYDLDLSKPILNFAFGYPF
ncbi:surface antigen (D15) [Galbibacter marinus]|uniref:Surface antigen (D15) n=1 Tax=Galbibacter marinus TaxID=555500 RepID=K2PSZ7_9FLAO|nr:BamA/TamA family outer membrane protein [Galbibacter marinus]EKF55700.1 surface antigen (D15) [Galbibacter marinus]